MLQGLSATFSDNQCGNFTRVFLISTNAFEQTGGPSACGGGGGGGCYIANPASTLLMLDGAVEELGRGFSEPLTVRGTAEDGTSLVLDQFAVVRAEENQVRPLSGSWAFGKVLNEDMVIGRLRGGDARPLTMAISSTRVKVATTPALLIQHQGLHAENHNFAPTPKVTLKSQRLLSARGATQQGWAVLNFGKSGQLQHMLVLPADEGAVTQSLRMGLKAAVHTTFLDSRRHAHTVYVAFEATRAELRLRGAPVVTLPMCCVCPGYPMCY